MSKPEKQKLNFYHTVFLEHIFLIIQYRLMKFSVNTDEILIKGRVSQIFYLGPSFFFMKCRKLGGKFFPKVSRFLTLNKN